MSRKEDTAHRIHREAEIEISAGPDEVFPLFTPVGESLWTEDWNPVFHHPEDGEVEKGAVFSSPDGHRGEQVWTVLAYDPTGHQITYLYTEAGYLQAWIEISCSGNPEGTTKVTVAYIYTALSEEGRTWIGTHSQKAFRDQITHWQHAINLYLRSGGTRT